MVIVINSVIDGFSWVDLVWLVASTPITGVQLQPTVWLYFLITTVQNGKWKMKQLIMFEEIVMVMIREETTHALEVQCEGANISVMVDSNCTRLVIKMVIKSD